MITFDYMGAALFDHGERNDASGRRYDEPSYRHLNRSARSEYADIRSTLQGWFDRYPPQHQNELRTRFRSDNDGENASAFFELFVYEFLKTLDLAAEVHPLIIGLATTPAFCVTESANHFYLEARIVNDSLKDDPGDEKRRQRVLRVIDAIPLKDFLLSFEEESLPATDVPDRKIKGAITAWLKSLDWRTERDRMEAGVSLYPVKDFDWNGYKIRLRAIPRTESQRGSSDTGLLGGQFGKGGIVPSNNAVHKAIKDKATKYGNLDAPFLICLNVIDRSVWSDSDLADTLLGDDQIVDVKQADGSFRSEIRRTNGSFGHHANPHYTRVSGVLAFRNLFHWSLPTATVRLFHNPWATRPYSGVLNSLPTAKEVDGIYTFSDGRSVLEIFRLESD